MELFEVLLKERNWKHYCSIIRPGPMYKEYEKFGLWRKWNSCLYCFRMLKTSTEGVRTSETWQWCQNALLEKWGFNIAEMLHTQPEKVLESEDCRILWDFPIQTDKTLEHNRQDITVIDKKSKKYLLIDPACPFDTRIEIRNKKNAQLIVGRNMKLQKFGKSERQ